VLEAEVRIDVHGDDLLGRRLGDLLDRHAALGRRDDRDLLGRAVERDRKVELVRDRGALLDVHLVHDLALGPGLRRAQRHAEYLAGDLLRLRGRLRELDPAALAAAARVDLRLHHDGRAAERARALLGYGQ